MLGLHMWTLKPLNFQDGKKAKKEDPKMSKTKLKKLQKLEVHHLALPIGILFFSSVFRHLQLCWFGCVQEEKKKKLLQAKSIEVLQYAP